jgi:hypothetical protein
MKGKEHKKGEKEREEKLTMVIAYRNIMMTTPAVTQLATVIYPFMTTSLFRF